MSVKGWRMVWSVIGALLLAGVAEGGVSLVLGAAVFNEEEETVTYTYRVDNSEGNFAVAAFALDFPVKKERIDWDQRDVGNGGDVLVPTGSPEDPFDGWVALAGNPTVGMTAQDFFAVNPAGSSDVIPGTILDGFSFTSSIQPGLVPFTILGPDGEFIQGVTVGPVPEPRWFALMAGMGAVGFAMWRRGSFRV